MTPEERQLVTGLFDRMRNYSLPEKDGEAEALINERVRALPDAPYMLVQSVLVQEQALQEADSRIKALEEQVRALEAPQRPTGSGNFLGGLFGSRPPAEPARGPSVPVIGARATPSTYAGGTAWDTGADAAAGSLPVVGRCSRWWWRQLPAHGLGDGRRRGGRHAGRRCDPRSHEPCARGQYQPRHCRLRHDAGCIDRYRGDSKNGAPAGHAPNARGCGRGQWLVRRRRRRFRALRVQPRGRTLRVRPLASPWA